MEEVYYYLEWAANDPETLPKPRYKYPPVIFISLDDLTGNNECFKRGICTISNLTINIDI